VWAHSGSSVVLFYWSTCLFLCQYHTALLLCSVVQFEVSYYTLALLFLLRIALVIGNLLCFLVNFRIDFSISVKNEIGIFMGIVMNLYLVFCSTNSAQPWTWEIFLSSSVLFNFFFVLFLVVLGFELRASILVRRCSTTFLI
jgi:hypothetical protein